MDQIRWIIMSSFLMLLVQFTATALKPSSSTVRVGDEVTLSCGNGIDDQDQCYSATWFFTGSGNKVTLFEHGQIHKEVKTKSDGLSVTENCSLVIKKVTDEDAGSYICRQFRSGEHYGRDTVYLSVVTMTEQKNDDTVTLICSVSRYCDHSMKWLYEGDKNDVETTQFYCSATVTFTSHLHQKSKYYELLKCKVTEDYSGNVHLFSFIPLQSSSEKPGDDATTTISPTTNESPMTTGNKWTSEETNNTTSENNNQTKPEGWWRIIVMSLGLASLITSVVVVHIWARAKGKTFTDETYFGF